MRRENDRIRKEATLAPDNEKLIDSEKFADNEQQKHEDQGDALLGRRRVAQKAISAQWPMSENEMK